MPRKQTLKLPPLLELRFKPKRMPKWWPRDVKGKPSWAGITSGGSGWFAESSGMARDTITREDAEIAIETISMDYPGAVFEFRAVSAWSKL